MDTYNADPAALYRAKHRGRPEPLADSIQHVCFGKRCLGRYRVAPHQSGTSPVHMLPKRETVQRERDEQGSADWRGIIVAVLLIGWFVVCIWILFHLDPDTICSNTQPC